MRYEVRHANGYWKLFDTVRFLDIALFDSLKQAHAECDRMNAPRGRD